MIRKIDLFREWLCGCRDYELQARVNELEAQLERVRTKCRRWQKQIDDGFDPRNPVVQAARDETLQMVINTLLENDDE